MVTMLIKEVYIELEKIEILRTMSVDNETNTKSNRNHNA